MNKKLNLIERFYQEVFGLLKRLRRFRKGGALLLFTGVVCLFALSAQATIPQQINYQGKLTNASNIPLSGIYSMVFTIYDAESGGTAIWTETQTTVTAESGFFNVILGSVTPIPPLFTTEATTYLGIKVGADSEMTPRQKLVSVGYAFKAYDANNLGGYPPSYYAPATSLGNYVLLGPETQQTTAGANAVWVKGGTIGVSGEGASIGVYGAESTTYSNYGYLGWLAGMYGYGVYGAGQSYGVYAVNSSTSASGYLGGVYGAFGSDPTYSNYGYLGDSSGLGVSGMGVTAGVCGTDPSGFALHYGYLGSSPEAAGVYGYANDASGYALRAEQANASGYAIYANGGKNYFSGPLTVANTIETTSGGYKFPDGTTQLTACTGGGGGGAGYVLLGPETQQTTAGATAVWVKGSDTGVSGEGGTYGVWGQAPNYGVHGQIDDTNFGELGRKKKVNQYYGVYGQGSAAGVYGQDTTLSTYGELGNGSNGVYGYSSVGGGFGSGVYGTDGSNSGYLGMTSGGGIGMGVNGWGQDYGVYGYSVSGLGIGVCGYGKLYGVRGLNNSAPTNYGALAGVDFGVSGEGTTYGVSGKSVYYGVYGRTDGGGDSYSVFGTHEATGTYGYLGGYYYGGYAQYNDSNRAMIGGSDFGISAEGTNIGVYAKSSGYAGYFEGNLKVTGTIEGASPVKVIGGLDVQTGGVRASTFESTVADGTPPLTVVSSTAVTNLNADLLDGQHASDFLSSAGYVQLGPATMQTTTAAVAIYVSGASGIYGIADTSGNGNVGIGGVTYQALGSGVFGNAFSTSADMHYGGYFQASGEAGVAVYGRARSTSGTNYGVYAETKSTTDGYGVYSKGRIGTNSQIVSTLSTGTAPLSVASTTEVTNLNADLLDGKHASEILGDYVLKTGDTMTGTLTNTAGTSPIGINVVNNQTTTANNLYGIYSSVQLDDSTYVNSQYGGYFVAGGAGGVSNSIGVYGVSNASNFDNNSIGVYGSGNISVKGEYNDTHLGCLGGSSYGVFGGINDASGYAVLAAQANDSGYAIYANGGKNYMSGQLTVASTIESTVATGTAPFTIASTTKVDNLNADLLDGQHASDFLSSAGYVQLGPTSVQSTSSAYAVWVQTTLNNPYAAGVNGLATGASGIGVAGQAYGTSGWGVFGYATAETGSNYGGRFVSKSSSGYGVYGKNDAASGTNYGVYGETNSGDGYGIYSKGKLGTEGQIVSTLPDGTAPLTVVSTTLATNFNADLLDGQHASDFVSSSALSGYVLLGPETQQTTAGATAVWVSGASTGVYGEGATYGVFGVNGSNYGCLGGAIYGVYGRGNVGIWGANADDANKYGSLGSSDYGVYGQYSATKFGFLGGTNYGVYGRGTTGVYGSDGTRIGRLADANYGAYGSNGGSNYGYLGGDSFSVYGSDGSRIGYLGSADYGAYGYYDSSHYGYFGSSDKGAYGYANDASGSAVYAEQNNASGYSLYAAGGKNYMSGQLTVASTIESTVSTGTAPLTVASTTKVANLNADLLDDHDSSYFATAGSLGSYVLKAGDTMTGTLTNTAGTSPIGINVINNQTTTANNLYGIYSSVQLDDSDAYTRDQYGGYFVASGSGSVSNSIGVYGASTSSNFDIDSIGVYGSGRLGVVGKYDANHFGYIGGYSYGVYGYADDANGYGVLASQNNPSGYALYSMGAKNYFSGSVGIGTGDPGATLEVVGNIKATKYESTVATGTAPFTVASTTKVTNLNADLLDGQHASEFVSTSEMAAYVQLGPASQQDSASTYGAWIKGNTYGLHGQGASYGVYGTSDGTNYGYIGGANIGAFGFGTTYGVHGQTNSDSTIGVYGEGLATNSYGVYGSGTAYGVYGTNGAGRTGHLGSANYGAYGQYDASNKGYIGGSNFGVSAEGTMYGVYGITPTDGQTVGGVVGSATGATYGIGIAGQAYGTAGWGVFGAAPSTANATKYGGRFVASGEAGVGVYGKAQANSGINYGVYGETKSSSGYGVYSKGRIWTDSQIVSTLSTGTAPLSVASSTNVTNLNADLLDDQHASDFVLASTLDGYVKLGPETQQSTAGATAVWVKGATTGVSGEGTTYGVYGQGLAYGVCGLYDSSNKGYIGGSNFGVSGEGTTYGVWGKDNSGHYGYLGGDSYGAYGQYSATQYGILGYPTYGVYGRGTTGVYGTNGTTEGYLGSANYGAFGWYDANHYGYLGSSSYGAYGSSTSSNGYLGGTYGAYGQFTADTYGYLGGSGAGVYGHYDSNHYASIATGNQGGEFYSGSPTESSTIQYGTQIFSVAKNVYNYGVHSTATGYGSGKSYGIYAIGNGGATNTGDVIGVYGTVAGTYTTGWAGYFEGKLKTTDTGGTNHVYDIAELIPCAKEVEAADVVVINTKTSREAIKCSTDSDAKVIGIISADPQFSIGDRDKANAAHPGKNFNFIALAGQVPCKVSTKNGPIQAGDLLTTSDIPGHAVKAVKPGPIVAKALEDFDGSTSLTTSGSEGQTGKILVFVNVGWYGGSTPSTGLGTSSLTTSESQELTEIKDRLEKLEAKLQKVSMLAPSESRAISSER